MSRRSAFMVVGCAALVAALWFVLFRSSPKHTQPSLPQFVSYFMQPQFVDDAFAVVGSVSVRADVSMALVNHHLLASNFIAHVFATIATDDAVSVVLVAPDHFAGGIAPITSVIADWQTPFGIVAPDTSSIASLASAGVVHLMAKPFEREHGITNITMFIGRAMPHARLIPIIIRDDASSDGIDALAREIEALPGRVIVVGSFDFTHDATDAVARANDERSLGILERGRVEDAAQIVIDSKPGIRLMMRIAQMRGVRFTKLDMSNSAQLLRQPSRTDVTSYITGIWAP